jgi:hypothetical protein
MDVFFFVNRRVGHQHEIRHRVAWAASGVIQKMAEIMHFAAA